jgi:geranylgeranyl pyrophosphate synthase
MKGTTTETTTAAEAAAEARAMAANGLEAIKAREAEEPEGERGFEEWRAGAARTVTGLLEARFRSMRLGAPPEVARLLEAMEWTLAGGGKRLRPLLALAAAKAVCGDETAGMPAALSVEALHTYSLIHDDLPDLDDDPVRRGRPTVHARFGPALAILAGDALQSLAFELMCEAPPEGAVSEGALSEGGQALVPRPDSVARAVKILAHAAGALGMAGGQAEDLAFEGRDPSEDERSGMARRKTAMLIAASLQTGAALAGATEEDLDLLEKAGLALGEAFQIRDDLLNVSADPALTGKASGTDISRGKASFLALVGREGAEERLSGLLKTALASVSKFRSGRLARLFDALVTRGF